MKTPASIQTRKDYFAWAAREFPRRDEPAAQWAVGLAAGWRLHCARVKRDPADTGDKRQTDPMTVVEAEDAARAVEAARHEAEVARANGCPSTVPELSSAWLAVRGRAPDGRPFANA